MLKKSTYFIPSLCRVGFVCLRQTSSPADSTATLAAVETAAAPTTAPSPTPIPAPTRIWFIGGALSTTEAADYGKQISDLAAAAGLQYEQQAALGPESTDRERRFAQSGGRLWPRPRFEQPGRPVPGRSIRQRRNPNLTAAGNLYQVAPTGLHPEWTGYMAGYIAAVLTDEWRIGMLD